MEARCLFNSCYVFMVGGAPTAITCMDLAAGAVQGVDFGWLLNTTVVASTKILSCYCCWAYRVAYCVQIVV